MRRVLVFGASGYSGLELVRLLGGHPHVRIAGASSNRWAGQRLADYAPQFPGPDRFVTHDALGTLVQAGDVAFLATHATVSHGLAPKLLAAGLTVIDVSGAFRLATAADYARWYDFEHAHPALLASAVYGLPELFSAARAAAKGPLLVANPGCYATAAMLAVAPLVRAGLLESGRPIILDGKSGATGAGRKLADSLLFSEVAETIRPYRLTGHQHTPEIERHLGRLTDVDVNVTFTAHLASFRRGLLVSAYSSAKDGVDQAAIDAAFEDLYREATFVRVLADREPHPGPVVGTNFCDVRAVLDPRTRTILSFGAIDNLVKGAAGQAVQNLNIVLGVDEATGLLPEIARD